MKEKDPAFLFYSKDFYEGTRTMTPDERACYVDLMIYQHQHEFIPNDIKRILLYCNGIAEATLITVLKEKFTLTENGYINSKLQTVILKRAGYLDEQSLKGANGQFFKKAKSILSVKEYEKLKEIFKNQTNKCIYEQIKDITINKATLIAMLKLSLNNKAIEDAIEIKDINKDNNIEIRKENFKEDLKPFLEIYGKDLLNDFFLYWTEMNQGGKKMRFEMQTVFDIKRRLNTWHKNSTKNNFTKQQKTIPLIADTSEVDKARKLQMEYLNSLKKHETLIN